MKFDLLGNVAMVTGSARGIGKATAEVFAQNGINLIMCDIEKEELAKSAEEMKKYGVEVLPVIMDAASEEDILSAIAKGEEKFGKIDYLIHCAAIIIATKMTDCTNEIWDRTMNIDLRSVFQLSKHMANQMIRNKVAGRIITISSQASKVGEYGNGPYSCAKAAVNTLTQVLAQELAEHGITVNAICPGYVNTVMMNKTFYERGPIEGMTGEEYKKKLEARIPLGRMAEPDEIGKLIAFLASESGKYITGIAVTIAGGSTLF